MTRPASISALAAAASAAVLALVATPTPASAQQAWVKEMGNLLGLTSTEKDDINYRERAPLVLPPQYNLPAPERHVAERSPNWPRDPDRMAKRLADAEARKPAGKRDGVYGNTAMGAPLSGQEMQSYGRLAPGQSTPRAPVRSLSDKEMDMWMRPDKLQAESQEPQTVADDSGRTSLTDPPAGLMTPSDKASSKGGFEPRAIHSMRPNAMEYMVQQRKE